jgi:multidrug efflux pump subunit AcrA (membrane-fusion protein)
MDQPDDIKILPGMAGQAWGDRETAILAGDVGIMVPISAVITSDGEKQNSVWVIDEESGQVSQRKVTAGKLSDDGILIDERLKPGEWVAIAGVHTLKEGQKVRIVE